MEDYYFKYLYPFIKQLITAIAFVLGARRSFRSAQSTESFQRSLYNYSSLRYGESFINSTEKKPFRITSSSKPISGYTATMLTIFYCKQIPF
ncbi:unnamed protein product [Heterobilharzia americana]|nr:unnamed protein product [Heterobilharzia americana]